MSSDTVCPYLGMAGDPKSVLEFPSDGNFCYRVKKPAPVKIGHQAKYCLVRAHIDCPIYRADGSQAMPAMYLGRSKPAISGFGIIRTIGIIIIVVLGVFGFMLVKESIQNRGEINLGTQSEEKRDQISSTEDPGGIQGQVFQNTSPGMVGSGENEETREACIAPPGWVVYVVKPTDSLVRLSLIYGVTVAQLQRANCLGNRILIYPGDELLVPGPTATPRISPTPTSSVTRTAAPYIPPPATATNPPAPPAPAATHTSVPPTQPPPTPTVVPTITEIPSPTPNPEV